MPLWRSRRPLKRWRYVGVYGPELMLCAGDVHIGPLRQRFWALAFPDGRLLERTALFGSGGLAIDGSRVSIDARGVRARVEVQEDGGVETLSPHGRSYIWTRKQAGIPVTGSVEVDGRRLELHCEGVIDDSAGYHARHTAWAWSAGVGRTPEGRRVAWNLVTGVHDGPGATERAVWLDGEPREVGPVEFAPDLSSVGGLAFTAWSVREDHTNALLLRSRYRQPFGTFSGSIEGIEVAQGYGVMETHDVYW